jgi:hypothetical protein
MTNLVMTNSGWLVSYLDEYGKTSTHRFEAIEAAADLMISLGVDTDEIDEALIVIYSSTNTRRARFNKDGKLYSTDIL